MDNLKPYNPDERCPKCGWTEAHTQYCPGGKPAPYYGVKLDVCWISTHEHFHRECARCHYEWHEACLPDVDEPRMDAEIYGRSLKEEYDRAERLTKERDRAERDYLEMYQQNQKLEKDLKVESALRETWIIMAKEWETMYRDLTEDIRTTLMNVTGRYVGANSKPKDWLRMIEQTLANVVSDAPERGEQD